MFKALLVVVTMLIVNQANASGVAVPTNIVNAPKAQFIGSMVTANNDSIGKINATATPLNPQFKDCASCNTWLSNSNGAAAVSGLAAKFTNVNMQTSWGKGGLVGFVGSCVDSQTGNSCAVPE